MKQLVHFLCFVTAPYAVLNIYLTTHTLKGTRAGLVTSRDLQGIRLWQDCNIETGIRGRNEIKKKNRSCHQHGGNFVTAPNGFSHLFLLHGRKPKQ